MFDDPNDRQPRIELTHGYLGVHGQWESAHRAWRLSEDQGHWIAFKQITDDVWERRDSLDCDSIHDVLNLVEGFVRLGDRLTDSRTPEL